MLLRDKGDPKSPVWIILNRPYEQDSEKGYLFSGSFGWFWDKMWQAANLPIDYYITCKYPDLEAPSASRNLFVDINYYKPTFIIPLGNITATLLPKLSKKKKGQFLNEVSMDKWAGSILVSDAISHPHYIIPNYPPDFAMSNYSYRDIQISIDLGHVKEEYDYWNTNKRLNPLPLRQLIVPRQASETIDFLQYCRTFSLLSCDIETIRPSRKKTGLYREHCGIPYTISFAYDPYNAISYSLWDYNEIELCKIWRETASLLSEISQIGQNYFSFDSHYLEQMGFELCLERCHDTMIRDHILWPELSHSLQDLTKRYTREPYYKDEGKQWHPKFKSALQRYNCLDTCVTYEVYLAQEKEFAARSHLL